jgi:hypothetical protein
MKLAAQIALSPLLALFALGYGIAYLVVRFYPQRLY